MQNQSFYNTINLSGEDLKRANARAATLEVLITAIFKANKGRKISPSQIHSIILLKYDLHPPLTSVRRGMTNLTNGTIDVNPVLEKTIEKIKGPYGVPEHLWMLRVGILPAIATQSELFDK